VKFLAKIGIIFNIALQEVQKSSKIALREGQFYNKTALSEVQSDQIVSPPFCFPFPKTARGYANNGIPSDNNTKMKSH